MEESQEILLNSLESSGVSIPPTVSSIGDLTPATLFTICSQALRLMNGNDMVSFPTFLPDSVADQFKICTDLASVIKDLGYIGDTSFHKFLYPSEEDVYELIRFLVERLSKESESGRKAVSEDINGRREVTEENFKCDKEDQSQKDINNSVNINYQKVKKKFSDLGLTNEVTEFSFTSSGKHESRDNEVIKNPKDRDKGVLKNEEIASQRDDRHVSLWRAEITPLTEQASLIRHETEKLLGQERKLKEEINAKTSKIQHLQVELDLLKEAVRMAFDDYHPIDFCLEQLGEQIDSKRRNLLELKSQWDSDRETLEKKRRSLEELLCANNPEAQEKLQKLREVELEVRSIMSEVKMREEEQSRFSADLEKQPKQASRSSYINRVKEITKNTRKQDADIERILKETRELQLESNSIQERLHRTYAVVDELVFREAKKDPVGRQAYRLLTSIHESFEQMSEKILTTDRIRREGAEHEKKLTALVSRRLNVDKLQADLDAIRRENEYLEEHLHNNS